MYYVYLLHQNNGDIYTGSTGNLPRRVQEHEGGRVKSTRYRRPVKLLGYEAYILKSDAKRREKYLKSSEGKRLMRQQYRDIIEKLQ